MWDAIAEHPLIAALALLVIYTGAFQGIAMMIERKKGR